MHVIPLVTLSKQFAFHAPRFDFPLNKAPIMRIFSFASFLTIKILLGGIATPALAEEAAPEQVVSTENEAQEKQDGFVPLFDGKTLDGWDGNPKLWKVEEGAIVGTTSDDAPMKHNEFLIWEGSASDFELRLEFRVADYGKGNSGIQYRAKRFPKVGKWVVGGYQADIDRTNRYMGILYEERGRGILVLAGEKAELHPGENNSGVKKEVTESLGKPAELLKHVKAGEWTDFHIIAEGNHLVHKINDQVVMEVTDHDKKHAAESGLIALQLHAGPAMKIEFRNIRLRQIGEGAKENSENGGEE